MKTKKILSLQLFLVATFASLITFSTYGQNCDCDKTVDLTTRVVDNSVENLPPGSTICIQAGVRSHEFRYTLEFKNFQSSDASQRYTFKNCGGQVVLQSTRTDGTGLVFTNCKNFRVTGSGDPNIEYGILVDGALAGDRYAPLWGVACSDASTDFEIDRVRVQEVHFAGFGLKTDPGCHNYPYAWRGNFTMRNVSVHDNLVDYTHTGEGFYIGYTKYSKEQIFSCDGGTTARGYGHTIENIRVFRNKTLNTGSEGIQVGSANVDCEIYGNHVENYGLRPLGNDIGGQGNGMQLGDGTTGKCYNNFFKATTTRETASAIKVFGINNVVYNNIIIEPYRNAMYVDERPGSDTGPGSGYKIYNNTIINPVQEGLVLASDEVSMNWVKNNIMVRSDALDQYVSAGSTVPIDSSHNFRTSNISNVKFVSPSTHDYRLANGSPCINNGINLYSEGVTIDFAGVPRPSSGNFEQGAYEYEENILPVANAGSDKTIYAPESSVTLSGSGTDQDGTIQTFSWSQVSGPNSATIQSPSSSTTNVTGLVEGVYNFRLTVTDDDNATDSDDVTVTVLAADAWSLYINTGGNAGTYDGNSWEEDKQLSPHPTYDENYHSLTTGSEATFSGTNTTSAPNQVLGSYRYTSSSFHTLKYDIPVPAAGDYKVNMFFAKKDGETYTSGARRFDIVVEGVTVRAAYDVHDEAGSGSSSFEYTSTVTDGILEIKLVAVSGAHAQINGMSIFKIAPTTADPISITINTGGNEYTEAGTTWEKDMQTDPHPYLQSTNTYTTGSTATFSGNNPTTAPNEVLGSYRYTSSTATNTITYDIAVPEPGDYDIELFFGRKDSDTFTSGDRRFKIIVEGVYLRTYDIYDEGGTGASSYSYTAAVSDAVLRISLEALTGSVAQISAMKIVGPITSTTMSAMNTDFSDEETSNFYPNPATDYFEMDFTSAGWYQVQVVNEGTRVYLDETFEVTSPGLRRFDISMLPANEVYYINLLYSGTKRTIRLIKM